MTMMNLSGEAALAIKNFYKVENENILVVHDELDISFGQIRVRLGGGSAGNNGVKSVSEKIGESYWRARIGIAQKDSPKEAVDFVLGKFDPEENDQARAPEERVLGNHK